MSRHHSSQSLSQSSHSKPPVSLHGSTHLDPAAYVRGTHPIALGHDVLIHPRAQLSSTHGSLDVGDGCVVSEKAVLGGTAPASSSDHKHYREETVDSNTGDRLEADLASPESSKTIVGKSVHIHSHASILSSSTIGSYTVLEAHSTILPHVTIGSHCKICAGVTVTRNVPDWTVVFGDGNQRRMRVDAEVTEKLRLNTMDRGREATTAILRHAAAKAQMAPRKK